MNMKNDIKSTETTVEPKGDAERKAPLFARFVQTPKVRTGIRSGIRNLG